MYEHIDYQLLGAAAYGAYALVHLSPRFDSWSKRRVLLLGYAPALLAGAVFLSQLLMELALLDGGRALPPVLDGFYQAFYANWVLFALLAGLVATGYLLLHGSAILAARASRSAGRPKRRRKGRFGIRSDEDCIDALDESAEYLRRKRRRKTTMDDQDSSGDDAYWRRDDGYWAHDGGYWSTDEI